MQITPHLIASSAARRAIRRLSASTTLVATCALALTAAPASAASCDLVAAQGGSDQAAGTVGAPFATVQHLVDQLGAGQTGCVRAGTYSGDVTFNHGGSAGTPITLTTYPGDPRATIIGRMRLPSGSDDITVSGLELNGVNHRSFRAPRSTTLAPPSLATTSPTTTPRSASTSATTPASGGRRTTR